MDTGVYKQPFKCTCGVQHCKLYVQCDFPIHVSRKQPIKSASVNNSCAVQCKKKIHILHCLVLPLPRYVYWPYSELGRSSIVMTANCIMPHCLSTYVVCSVTKQSVGTGRLMCPTIPVTSMLISTLCRNGHLEIVRHLLDKGCGMDSRSNYGNTPLLLASL